MAQTLTVLCVVFRMHRTLLREELDDEEAKNLGLTKKEEGGTTQKSNI